MPLSADTFPLCVGLFVLFSPVSLMSLLSVVLDCFVIILLPGDAGTGVSFMILESPSCWSCVTGLSDMFISENADVDDGVSDTSSESALSRYQRCTSEKPSICTKCDNFLLR